MRFSARVFFVVLLLFVLLTGVFTPFAQAQVQTTDYTSALNIDPKQPINIPNLTQGVIVGLLSTATCLLGGVDFSTPNHRCLSSDTKTNVFGSSLDNNGGMLGMVAGGIALTYNPPFHTTDYTQYLSQNFGFVKSAKAANGIGFDQLSPITNLWLAFRNLAYLIFVILFVIVGFAVMLRAKIDPRTVMTIENQIPKLIVALILITFSFAIAGVVIDIMWVGVYLVINIFASLDPVLNHQLASLTSSVKADPFSWVNSLNNGPLGFVGIAMQAAGGVKDMVTKIVSNILDQAAWIKFIFLFSIEGIVGLIGCAISGAVNGVSFGLFGQSIGDCLNGVLTGIIATIIGGVAFLIFGVALFVAIAKVWWHLIKSYTLFLIFSIFGPLIIMSGVIPGWTKTNFEWWLRHLLAYALVFPTTMGVFLLGKTLMDVYSTQTVTSATAVPPLIGASGVGTGALAFMGPLLGFAVMMLAPQSLAMIQDALNAPDPKYLASIGQAIGVGAQAYGGLGNKVLHRWTREEDRLKGLDEGWLRKAFLGPRDGNNRWRQFWIGKEMPGFNPNKT